MDGRKGLIKLTNPNDKIQDLWEEIIVKEKIKNMTVIMDDIKKDQTQIRQIIKEELTNLWNISEIPTFKIILEKLTKLEESKKDKQIIAETSNIEPEIVPINAWKRCKEPIMVDISKMKPNIPTSVDKVLKGLALLHKEGKF